MRDGSQRSLPMDEAIRAAVIPTAISLDEAFPGQAGFDVAVVVWGPSPRSPIHSKKQEIVEYLRALDPSNHVFSSEEPIERGRGSDGERYQAHVADLIIWLLTDDIPEAGGPDEVFHALAAEPGFNRKLRLLQPRAGKIKAPKLDPAAESLGYHRLRYTKSQLESLDDILARCADWVATERMHKYLATRTDVLRI